MASYVQFPGAGGQPPGFVPYGAGAGPYPGQQSPPAHGAAPPGMIPIRLADGSTAFAPANQMMNGGRGGGWPQGGGAGVASSGSSPGGLIQQQMGGYPPSQIQQVSLSISSLCRTSFFCSDGLLYAALNLRPDLCRSLRTDGDKGQEILQRFQESERMGERTTRP